MRSSECTPAGIRFRSVTALTGAQHGADDARLQGNFANHMILGVGDVEQVTRTGEPLRPSQFCQARRTTVARIPLFASSRHMMKGQGFGIHSVNGVALSKCEVQLAGSIERNCPRAVERCSLQMRTIWSWQTVTGAREGLDETRRELDVANAMIADVADEQEPARRLHGDAMWLTQSREGCGPTVAGESRSSHSGQSGDDTCRIHLTNHMVVALRDVEIPARVELNLVGHVQRRIRRCPAVTRIASLPISRDGLRSTRLQIQSTNTLVT